jgi:tetratricopeptide (TPR) repeat protein
MSRLKKILANSALTVALLAGFAAVTIGVPMAQESRQFSTKTGRKVLEAQELMQSDQCTVALGKLSEALGFSELNAYERSIIYQMQGQCYYELNQNLQAIKAFESAIEAGGFLPNESSALRVNIAQLLISSDQFARGAQMLEDWSRRGGQLQPQHIEMLWYAWLEIEEYARALPWAESWFNAANPKERKHFDLMNLMYSNLKMPEKREEIIKQMIFRWPNDRNLWELWVYMLANSDREQDAFEVSKLLYLGGLYSTEQDLNKVVQYYSFYDMPYQAAQILEREMNAGRIRQTTEKLIQLSDLYRQAREYKRAVPILEKAASTAGTPKSYADLGEALYNEGDCNKAENAFKQAMNKGYDQGKAWMLIANCRYDEASAAKRPVCPLIERAETRKIYESQINSVIEASNRGKLWKTAIAAFNNVPRSSNEASNADKWKSFIRSERVGFKDRCVFRYTVEIDTCFLDIGLAYDQMFLARGEFKLEDEKCMKYKADYDSKYRQNISEG